MKMVTVIDGHEFEFHIQQNHQELRIEYDGNQVMADCVPLSNGSFSVLLNGKSYLIKLYANDGSVEVTVGQQKQIIQIKDETRLLLEKYGFKSRELNHVGEIHVPIPGLLTHIFVKPGDKVEKGEKLAILEAMKMENEISAPVAGMVKKCHISEGTAVDKGELIMELDI
ncbi:MAG: biotin/lipoyl-binding protein [Candidatus Marinimicrobia bacterium]|nr:biotin/lipoyl-binding protein [Candidatus Neomarinimicrobiota bacterium]